MHRYSTLFAALAVICLIGGCSGEAVSSAVVNPEDGPEDHGEIQPVSAGKNDQGQQLLEGDMVVLSGDGQNRNARPNLRNRWPKSKDGKVYVPYKLRGFSPSVVAKIQSAMDDFAAYSCIRFIKRTNQKGYMDMYYGSGCWSAIGYYGDMPHQLSLGNGCHYKGVAAHEMLHGLNFMHEHMRPDRDQYINVHWGNIQASVHDQFEICKDCKTMGLPYDYGSVMHYSKTTFSRSWNRYSITPKDPNASIGQRRGLSILDLKKLNKYYECEDVVLPTEPPTTTRGPTTAPPPTTSPPTTTTTTEPCVDRTDCSIYGDDLEDVCTDAGMVYWCSKSCGFCGGPKPGTGPTTEQPPTTEEPCEDRIKDCSGRYTVKQCRRDSSLSNYWCRKFCGTCNGPQPSGSPITNGGPTTTEALPTTEHEPTTTTLPTTEHEPTTTKACKDRMDCEASYRGDKRVCRHSIMTDYWCREYCGSCGGTTAVPTP